MRSGGGADAAKTVGTRRGNAPDDFFTATGVAQRPQQLLRYRVRGAAQADGGIAPRRRRAHAGAARQNQRQRARPKGLHQLPRKGGDLCSVVLGS